MALAVSSMVAQPFALSTSYTLTVVDQTSSRNVTIGTVSTNTYWRNLLAASGSPTTPSTVAGVYKDFLSHIQAQINAATSGSNWWSVIVPTTGPAAGFVQFYYSGAGTGTITIPTLIANILGYLGNISIASPAHATGAYLPMYTLAIVGRSTDGYQLMPQKRAAATMASGAVYGWQDSSRYRTMTLDAHAIPFDSASAAANNLTGTTAWPTENPSRIWTPSGRVTSGECTPLAGTSPPWTWADFVATALGQSCGAVWGTFAQFLPSITNAVDTVYATPDALAKMQTLQPLAPNFMRALKWSGMGFNHTGYEAS